MKAGDQTADSYSDRNTVNRGGLRRAAAPEAPLVKDTCERL